MESEAITVVIAVWVRNVMELLNIHKVCWREGGKEIYIFWGEIYYYKPNFTPYLLSQPLTLNKIICLMSGGRNKDNSNKYITRNTWQTRCPWFMSLTKNIMSSLPPGLNHIPPPSPSPPLPSNSGIFYEHITFRKTLHARLLGYPIRACLQYYYSHCQV